MEANGASKSMLAVNLGAIFVKVSYNCSVCKVRNYISEIIDLSTHGQVNKNL